MKRPRCSDTGQELFISHRANDKALSPYISYFAAIGNGRKRKWTTDNQEGMLVLALAENNLTQQPLLDRLQKAMQEVTLSPTTLMYADWEGLEELRDAVAGLANHTFMKGENLEAKHLVVSAGAGAIIDNLFYSICDAGDGVLIPAPYYPAFDNDLEVKIDTRPVPVHLDFEGDITAQLEAAAQQSADRGTPVKVLLVTNPNNPLGTIYSHKSLLKMLKWALNKGIHFVSDEIYALSVWGEGAVFESTELVAQELEPHERELTKNYLHTVFGLSKDFGASGLRVGALHTRNQGVLSVLGNVAYFCGVSNLTQQVVTHVLQDLDFIDSFVKENTSRMRASYKGWEGVLKAGGIKHQTPNSAMFCWLDLRELLRESTWEAEMELWQELHDKKKIIFTPGKFCHADAPGYFRCCWAWTSPEGLVEAAHRLVALKQEKTGNKPDTQ